MRYKLMGTTMPDQFRSSCRLEMDMQTAPLDKMTCRVCLNAEKMVASYSPFHNLAVNSC